MQLIKNLIFPSPLDSNGTSWRKLEIVETDIAITEQRTALIVNGTSAPAVVTLPETGGAVWGIVIVPGSFPNDIDGNYLREYGNPFNARPHTYKDLARQLAGCHGVRAA